MACTYLKTTIEFRDAVAVHIRSGPLRSEVLKLQIACFFAALCLFCAADLFYPFSVNDKIGLFENVIVCLLAVRVVCSLYCIVAQSV
jgi:hypothetical protein